ncbi:MAG: HigA family addiction module antitoxin [Alkalispirochaeta sp.]
MLNNAGTINELRIPPSNRLEKLPNIHPGEVLKEEFLDPMGISAYRLAKDTGIPQTRISQIIKGRRRVTADTALRLAKYFGMSARFWLGLQDDFDIEEEEIAIHKELESIPTISA